LAGYSGTPLFRKLGLRPGLRVRLVNVPPDVRSKLRTALAKCDTSGHPGVPIDFALIFGSARVPLAEEFRRATDALAPAGAIWASWPKKTSGLVTDLDDRQVRDIGLKAGLVDVKVCAITDYWSGLKFVRRLKDRK
jgi:hypothetical protein